MDHREFIEWQERRGLGALDTRYCIPRGALGYNAEERGYPPLRLCDPPKSHRTREHQQSYISLIQMLP